MSNPPRGFPEREFRARLGSAQTAMAKADLDALLLTTPADIYYFTGFLTRFWESPTRPWFIILPQNNDPIAVIPAIGEALMAYTWVSDIRTWPAPAPDDDGISLLAAALGECRVKRLGIPQEHETHLRMPLADFVRLKADLPAVEFTGDDAIVSRLRQVKSTAEIDKIEHACRIASRAFERVPEIAGAGISLAEVFRRFQILALEEGADWIPYLAGGAGSYGYHDVISPATDTPLVDGDVFMLDTGLVWDGYFCDFDRNFSVGEPQAEVAASHARLIDATAAGFDACKPGIRASDLFSVMDQVLTGGTSGPDSGRLGHGVGIQLTEPPSIIPWDKTELRPGMVLTLEPVIANRAGRLLVHEENIVVTEAGARYLTRPAGPGLIEVPA